jgi:hypothetical protein
VSPKMLFIIGLGLGDCKDITVRGLEIIKKCDRVYLESYTSILTCGPEALVSPLNWQILVFIMNNSVVGRILRSQNNCSRQRPCRIGGRSNLGRS